MALRNRGFNAATFSRRSGEGCSVSRNLRDDRFCERNVAGDLGHPRARLVADTRVTRAQEQHAAVAGIAQLVGLAGLQQHGIELFQHEFPMRRPHRALAFETHKDVVIVLVIMHVVLQLSVAVDDPEVSQIRSPQAQMIDLRIGVGLFDAIFHFDHSGNLLDLLLSAVSIVQTVQLVQYVQTVSKSKSSCRNF